MAYRGFAREALERGIEQHGTMLVVTGLPGAGKTFLLRDLVQAAVAKGHRTAFLRADEIERHEPFSFMERFVAGARIPSWHLVPSPHDDPFVIGRDCVQHLVGGAVPTLRLIVVDDAQWIDPRSQRVLRYLIPRLTRSGVVLAFGIRTPSERGGFGEFLATSATEDPLDELHELQPLTVEDIAALVLERHGAGISAHTAERILAETDGSFLAVDSILAALTEAEIARLHLVWDAPFTATAGGGDPLAHRFEHLDEATRRTCEIVCLAGHELTPQMLSTAAKILGEPVSIDEAVEADVLVVTGIGSSVMPRHALVARAIAATVPTDRTKAIHRALAAATTGHISLRHSLRGETELSDELRDRVDAYVDGAAASGSLEAASDVLRDALATATDPEDRARLLVDLALVHIEAKTAYFMLDLLDDLEALPPSIVHEFVAMVVGAHRPGAELPAERARALMTTPAASPDDAAVQGFFAFMAVILTMRTGDRELVRPLIAHAKALVARAPSDAATLSRSRLGFTVAQEGHLLVLDCYAMVQDQFVADMDAVAVALPGLVDRIQRLPDQPLKVDALVAVTGATIACGDLHGGRLLAQQGVDLLDHVREPWAAGTARLILSDCLVLEGDYAAAAAFMASAEQGVYMALDVETRVTWAALRVFMAAVTGVGDAEAHLAQARRQRSIRWEGYAPDQTLLAECEVARARSDPGAVLAATSDDATAGLANTRHGYLTYRAHALLDVGRVEDAARLIDTLGHWRGVRWQEFWGSLAWLRARLARAHGDLDGARWHIDVAVEQQIPPLPHALTLIDFARILAETGEVEHATEQIRAATELLERIGAHAYLPHAERALEGSAHGDGVDGIDRLALLTHRERQIAEQLANGRSNNQIAESLVVSVATVRSHVSNVLRKLRLTSRGEVARLLRSEHRVS